MNRLRILTVLTLLALVLIFTGCSGGSAVGIQIGDKAPDFQLRELNGQVYSLSEFRGKPVLLNFWATWCGPCRGEMPYLEEIYGEWGEKGLVFFGVNVGESSSGVRAFLESFNLSMPVLMDTGKTVTAKYNITGIPTTYFIDENGIIQERVIGAFPSKESLEQYLTSIIR